MMLSAVLAAPCSAQRGRANRQAQDHRAPRFQGGRQERQQQRQQRQQQRQPDRNPARDARQERRQNDRAGTFQGNRVNRPDSAARANGNPNRPPPSYTPPPVQRKFNDLSPQEKQRVIENYNRLNRMPPAQRQELQDRIATWNRLTPQQRNHIRNDVLPEWRHMPVDRRQAIRQRLRVLQNMPEFARNQRLNDPRFTEGMSNEDKATLRDLSHLHVGAPDPPND